MAKSSAGEGLKHFYGVSQQVLCLGGEMIPPTKSRLDHQIRVSAVDIYARGPIAQFLKKGGRRIGTYRTDVHRNNVFTVVQVRGNFVEDQRGFLDDQYVVESYSYKNSTAAMLQAQKRIWRAPHLNTDDKNTIIGVEGKHGKLNPFKGEARYRRIDLSESDLNALRAAQVHADITLEVLAQHRDSFRDYSDKARAGLEGNPRVYISSRQARAALQAA